ncbi:MAG: MbnP family protein, partial [Akkermansiaceae bacterium]
MKFLLLFLLTIGPSLGGSLRVDIRHQFDGKPLALNSLKYQAAETLSVSRLSYLLSEIAVQDSDGTWQELPAQFAWIDAGARRTSFTLTGLAPGSYKSLRFSLGVPRETNHGNPAQFPADHPLNPNLNNLHWNWAGGYIFLALEGKYRDPKGQLTGFVYHLANDANLSRIQLAARFELKNNTALGLSFDLNKLLTHPRPLSFEKDGNSTHSHAGDPIATALVANLQSAFSLQTISYPPSEAPREKIAPRHHPPPNPPPPDHISGPDAQPERP